MFGLTGLLGAAGGGGGGLPSVSSSATTGDQKQGNFSGGNVGGFGAFAVGSGAEASGGGSGAGSNTPALIAGGLALFAVLATLVKR